MTAQAEIYNETLKVAQHRGKPRVWMQTQRLAAGGFVTGALYSISVSGQSLTLTLTKAGDRKVSVKRRGAKCTPLIDLNTNDLRTLVPEGVERVCVSITSGKITLTVPRRDVALACRVAELKARLQAGMPVRKGEIFAGGGIMADAVKAGLDDAGVPNSMALIVERDPNYVEALLSNTSLVGDDTRVLCNAIQDVDLTDLPALDMLVAGIPCLGASKAGRARHNDKANAEAHPDAGTLFIDFLNVVRATGYPPVVIVENVPDYAHTVSAQCIRQVMSQWKYQLQERVIGREVGALEQRRRWFMVATAEGLNFDFSLLQAVEPAPANLGVCLEDIGEDSPVWSRYDYLVEKQARDLAAGKNFRMNIATPAATEVGTIGRHYSKVRSTEVKLQHPRDPALMRQLTVTEHARVKSVPEHLIVLLLTLSAYIAHQILGQSVLYNAPRAVARLVGHQLRALAPLKSSTCQQFDLFAQAA